jgi:predicted aconitase
MDELIENGYTAKMPFTVNPRPVDYKNVKCSLPEKVVFKIMYGKQKEYEEQLAKVGLKNEDAFSCTCYMPEVGNMPGEGEILAWAESSAVVFANSVLGARSNRNSGVIELFCGVLGKAPEFGLLTDEGRRAKWLVEVKTSKVPEAQVLGSAVGMKVVEDVPYIAGLDKYLGEGMNDHTRDYLKDMGAASASNGAVGVI